MTLKATLTALIVIAYAFCYWLLFVPAPHRTPVEQFTPAERAYYAARHRFHGIDGNVVDLRTGERSFERQGRVCRL